MQEPLRPKCAQGSGATPNSVLHWCDLAAFPLDSNICTASPEGGCIITIALPAIWRGDLPESAFQSSSLPILAQAAGDHDVSSVVVKHAGAGSPVDGGKAQLGKGDDGRFGNGTKRGQV